jgi:hypothetical protein
VLRRAGGPDGGAEGRSYSIGGWGEGVGIVMRLVCSERSRKATSLEFGS